MISSKNSNNNNNNINNNNNNNNNNSNNSNNNNNNNNNNHNNNNNNKKKNNLQADIEFLEYISHENVIFGSSIRSGSTTSSSSSRIGSSSITPLNSGSAAMPNFVELQHRATVLKYHTDELIEQSSYPNNKVNKNSSVAAAVSFLDSEIITPKWYTIAEQYMDTIHYFLQFMPEVHLSTAERFGTRARSNNSTNSHCPFEVFADRPVQCTVNPFTGTTAATTTTTATATDDSTENWRMKERRTESNLRIGFHYRNSKTSTVVHQLMTQCYYQSTGTTQTCSRVLPTIERTILLPNSLFQEEDNNFSQSHTKDYLRHRYTDKRNLIVWYVGKYLSQPEFQSVIGSVSWRYHHGDPRKPVLVLVPPIVSASDVIASSPLQQPSPKKHCRSNPTKTNQPKDVSHPDDDDDVTNGNDTSLCHDSPANAVQLQLQSILSKVPKVDKITKKKLCFRIVLTFQMESITWIPPLRLLPNRCNVQKGTIESASVSLSTTTAATTTTTNINKNSWYYNNNVLLEDAKHLWYQTAIIGSCPSTSGTPMNSSEMLHFSSHSNTNTSDIDGSWYKNWYSAAYLIQVWCTKRGLLSSPFGNTVDDYTSPPSDGLTIDTIILTLLYLFRIKQANPVRMTPVQIFTIWLKFITDTDWFGTCGGGGASNSISSSSSSSSSVGTDNVKQRQQIQQQKSNLCAVLVLPLPGMTEKQTITLSKLDQLYAEQAKHCVAPDGKMYDPSTLIGLYRQQQQQQRTLYNGTVGPVFLDPSMTYNFMGRISRSYMLLLQHESQKSLQCIHPHPNGVARSPVINNPFRYLFQAEALFWDRHDLYVRIDIQQFCQKRKREQRHMTKNNTTSSSSSPTGTSFDEHWLWRNYSIAEMGLYESTVRGLLHLLGLALGDRIRSMRPLLSNSNISSDSGPDFVQRHHPITADFVIPGDDVPIVSTNNTPRMKGKDYYFPTHLIVGISLNPDTCYRVLDRGPPADYVEEVQAFLNLWGRQKAELRRFKDGAIVHAIVWDNVENWNETNDNDSYIQFQNDDKWQGGIVERIIRYIVKIHLFSSNKSDSTNHPSMTNQAALPLKQIQETGGGISEPKFALRNMNSLIDAVMSPQQQYGNDTSTKEKERSLKNLLVSNPLTLNRMVLKAFDDLSTFLRKNSTPTIIVEGDKKISALGIPLAIDAVEPLGPALRYAELYPPTPHPCLGADKAMAGNLTKVAGAIQSDPIAIQIRFGSSSKWPTDLRAIGAAKTAMLIALANGIDKLKDNPRIDTEAFNGPIVVTSSHMDLGYKGFVFRIIVRADPELKVLRGLHQPSAAAKSLFRVVTRHTVIAAKHHSIVHAVYTSHPSSSATVRIARRWLASHLLSDHISFELLELLVVYIYSTRSSSSSPLDPPATVTAGFLRFLKLLSTYDWKHEALIVDPQVGFTDSDHKMIQKTFDEVRGSSYQLGPAMYVVSPCHHYHRVDDTNVSDLDNDTNMTMSKANRYDDIDTWKPVFSTKRPEVVVLNRVVALASRTYSYLQKIQRQFDPNSWSDAFLETPEAFNSYSALLRVDPDLIVDQHASSSLSDNSLGCKVDGEDKDRVGILRSSYSRSMMRRMDGPKELRVKMYRNLFDPRGKTNQQDHTVLLEWKPIQTTVQALRMKLGRCALFFYNDLCPEVIAVVWRRPVLYESRPFSALHSEFVHPATDPWKPDTMVTFNVGDILREIYHICTKDVVVNVKVIDMGLAIDHNQQILPPQSQQSRKRPLNTNNDSDSSFLENNNNNNNDSENDK